jgi:hypothetical protein
MYPRGVRALQADALFASALQRSDEVKISHVYQAIAWPICGPLGSHIGCTHGG